MTDSKELPPDEHNPQIDKAGVWRCLACQRVLIDKKGNVRRQPFKVVERFFGQPYTVMVPVMTPKGPAQKESVFVDNPIVCMGSVSCYEWALDNPEFRMRHTEDKYPDTKRVVQSPIIHH